MRLRFLDLILEICYTAYNTDNTTTLGYLAWRSGASLGDESALGQANICLSLFKALADVSRPSMNHRFPGAELPHTIDMKTLYA